MIRSGFTLLEILLATSLMALMAGGVFTWTSAQARSSQATRDRMEVMSSAGAIVRAIRDDLVMAIPDEQGRRFQMTADHITIMTLNRLPGDRPGFQQVSWYSDEHAGGLVRSTNPQGKSEELQVRLVSRRLVGTRFQTDTSGSLQLLWGETPERPTIRMSFLRVETP